MWSCTTYGVRSKIVAMHKKRRYIKRDDMKFFKNNLIWFNVGVNGVSVIYGLAGS